MTLKTQAECISKLAYVQPFKISHDWHIMQNWSLAENVKEHQVSDPSRDIWLHCRARGKPEDFWTLCKHGQKSLMGPITWDAFTFWATLKFGIVGMRFKKFRATLFWIAVQAKFLGDFGIKLHHWVWPKTWLHTSHTSPVWVPRTLFYHHGRASQCVIQSYF